MKLQERNDHDLQLISGAQVVKKTVFFVSDSCSSLCLQCTYRYNNHSQKKMSNEEHFRKLERMYLGAPVNEFYMPTIHISRGEAQVTIPVRPEFFHAAGAVHGVVYFKLLDDSSFFAANSLVEDVFVLTVSYNVYFTRPVSMGTMSAKGKVIQPSKRLLIAESIILDSDGNEVGRGSGTFMRSNIPLTEEIGYK